MWGEYCLIFTLFAGYSEGYFNFGKLDKGCRNYSCHLFNPPGDGPGGYRRDQCVQGTTGDTFAKPGEFPHMARLGLAGGGMKKISWVCSGSLISEKFILSAQQCIYYIPGGAVIKWALLGRATLLQEDEVMPDDRYEIEQTYTLAGYDSPPLYKDIALYKLKSPRVTFNQHVRPACVTDSVDKMSCFRSGFFVTGWTKLDGKSALRKVKLKLLDRQQCYNMFPAREKTELLPNGVTGNDMFCAEPANPADIDVLCQMEKGGPLQTTLKDPYCMNLQVAVSVYFPLCNSESHLPAVFIYAFDNNYRWIERIVSLN